MSKFHEGSKVFFIHEKDIYLGKIKKIYRDTATIVTYNNSEEYLEMNIDNLFHNFVDVDNIFKTEFPGCQTDVDKLMDISRYLDFYH